MVYRILDSVKHSVVYRILDSGRSGMREGILHEIRIESVKRLISMQYVYFTHSQSEYFSLCLLVVSIHASGISIPLSLLMLLG